MITRGMFKWGKIVNEIDDDTVRIACYFLQLEDDGVNKTIRGKEQNITNQDPNHPSVQKLSCFPIVFHHQVTRYKRETF